MGKIAKTCQAGLFKGSAFLGAITLIAVVWIYDATILVTGEDWNLKIIKTCAALLPHDYGSKMESALRLFGAGKAFLFTEAVVLVKLVMLAIGYPFRRNRKS